MVKLISKFATSLIIILVLVSVPGIAEEFPEEDESGNNIISYTIGEKVDLSFNFKNTYNEKKTFIVSNVIVNPNHDAPIPITNYQIISLDAGEETTIKHEFFVSETSDKGIYIYRANIKDNENNIIYTYEDYFEVYGTLSVFPNAHLYSCDTSNYCANALFHSSENDIKLRVLGVEGATLSGKLYKDESLYMDDIIFDNNGELLLYDLPEGFYEAYVTATLENYLDTELYTSFTVSNEPWIEFISETMANEISILGTTVSESKLAISTGQYEIVRVVNGIRHSSFITIPASSSHMDLEINSGATAITYYNKIGNEYMETANQLFTVDNAGLEKVYFIKIR